MDGRSAMNVSSGRLLFGTVHPSLLFFLQFISGNKHCPIFRKIKLSGVETVLERYQSM